MTGRLRFGKISTGMRTRARIEQSATPITKTTIVTGRRRAVRSSHIVTVPPAVYRAEGAGRVVDPRAPQRPRPGFAKQRDAPEHRQFRPALTNSARPQLPPAWPIPLGNACVPGSRWYARPPAPRACSPRHGELPRAKPALVAIVR